MSTISVDIFIENEQRNITSSEELREVLRQICLKQVYPKFHGIAYEEYPFKGPVYFNNKQIRFKLDEPLGDGKGLLKLFTETAEKYIKRNQIKEQIEDWYKHIIERSYSDSITTIFLSENIFLDRTAREINDNLSTIFSSEEVMRLSRKLSNPHIRYLLGNPGKNIDELHKIVMEYYKLYGGHILTFLLSLPPIKFADNKVFQIKNYKDRPLLIPTIKIQVSSTKTTELTICFYPPIKRTNGFQRVATVFNSNKESIGEISRQGHVISTNKKYSHKLSFFAKNFDNSKTVFFSGNETGKCNYCPQPLEHPVSIKWGYGEDCAKKLNLPYH